MSVHYNMLDIANKLSLSRSTISSVLNDKWREKNISEGTATRVLEYVEEIGYTPNLASLTLKGKISKDLAIILPLNCLEHQKKAFFDIAYIVDLWSKKRDVQFGLLIRTTNDKINLWRCESADAGAGKGAQLLVTYTIPTK